ncbi:TPA: helix-turn-helix domain-containing protein [Legionella pneumophila subsp. pneumophila]|uniref:Transposase (Resolvase, DNA invertase) n=2 Tax=Legionella TaxID=445 RepID=A0A0W1AMC0_9GAMM|nr:MULTISPECIES: recombinase family protein [Legionella]HAT8858123.1 helix-turn-helix domain-containing protein [Legionella pneumophila subsp. pneumophila]KTD82418.1 transposase (resolvase, DNA invertase) [Legionella waltersii]RJT44408.1 resolvase [Legionella taurinensis]SNU95646.1 transposase (resolvase, DNA invertase) [Legionella waltersii]HAT7074282.1 helix-turn-helix domain-containing protein [Legionella pneumophila]
MKAGIYARVSTHDQQTLNLQIEAMKKYAQAREWYIESEITEIGSGAKDTRPQREELINQAKRRQIDVIIVWKLDRWGRSVNDLFHTLNELNGLGVGFISLTEALDLTTVTGRAMAGLLAIFAEFEREILRERVKAGIAHARQKGKNHGRPTTIKKYESEIYHLFESGLSKSEIAKKLGIGRTSVRRILSAQLQEL